MTCEEIESLVFTPKDELLFKKNILYNFKITYQIIDWTNDIKFKASIQYLLRYRALQIG